MYNYFQLNSALNEFKKQACNNAVVLTDEKCDILECLERLRPTYLEPMILLNYLGSHQVYSLKEKRFNILWLKIFMKKRKSLNLLEL